MKNFDYENKEYLGKLNDLDQSFYSKYVEYVKSYIDKDSKFLDVGCGNGVVLKELKDKGFKKGYGVDISKLFIKEAKSKGLKNVYAYGGDKLPFENNFFDFVGSFNVLEHTQNPMQYLKNQIKVLKPNGFILVACPNFLSSVLISPHPRIKGIRSKANNLFSLYKKLIQKDSSFESMPIIERKPFQYDDDAIVVTNLIDLKRTLKKYKCRIVYESGFINYNSRVYKLINAIPLVRYSLPSCFVIAQKIK